MSSQQTTPVKYSDLIDFEPIESVLKLHEADEKETLTETEQ